MVLLIHHVPRATTHLMLIVELIISNWRAQNCYGGLDLTFLLSGTLTGRFSCHRNECCFSAWTEQFNYKSICLFLPETASWLYGNYILCRSQSPRCALHVCYIVWLRSRCLSNPKHIFRYSGQMKCHVVLLKTMWRVLELARLLRVMWGLDFILTTFMPLLNQELRKLEGQQCWQHSENLWEIVLHCN